MRSCYFNTTCPDINDDCQQHCIMFKKMDQLTSSCGIDCSKNFLDKLTPVTEDEYSTYKRLYKIKDDIKLFVSEGQNLLITSKNVLTGKTSWSIKLMYRYFFEISLECNTERKGYFINVPEFLDNIERSYYRNSDDYLELKSILKTVDLVIWDDLIKYPLSSTVQSSLGSIIESRIRNHKANIFNGLNVENMSDFLGEILTKDIKSAEHLNFDGESYKERMEIIKQSQQEVE